MSDTPMGYSRASDWADPPEAAPTPVWHIVGPHSEDFAHSVAELHEIAAIHIARGEPFTVAADVAD